MRKILNERVHHSWIAAAKGGCAEHEADARAMGSSEAVLSNFAPKHGRCVY